MTPGIEAPIDPPAEAEGEQEPPTCPDCPHPEHHDPGELTCCGALEDGGMSHCRCTCP